MASEFSCVTVPESMSLRMFRTPVHAAAYNDHVESLQMLLSSGGDASRADALGRTPLMYACMNGQTAALGAWSICCVHFQIWCAWVESKNCLSCCHSFH